MLGLLDRLIKKENQTATVPLLSDIPPYVDSCKVVLCNERGGKYVQSFRNAENASGNTHDQRDTVMDKNGCDS